MLTLNILSTACTITEPLLVLQSPPKGATIPYRPKPAVPPVVFTGGQAYVVQNQPMAIPPTPEVCIIVFRAFDFSYRLSLFVFMFFLETNVYFPWIWIVHSCLVSYLRLNTPQVINSKWLIASWKEFSLIMYKIHTHKPLYNTVHYNLHLDITLLKDGSQKMFRLYRKITINLHFSI